LRGRAGPPLLAAAFAWFLRRRVETDPELARGLHFEQLQVLAAGQSQATIIGEDIVELELRPQERTTEVGSRYLTVYRLDFAATVKNAEGEMRQVPIEIQKAKLATDKVEELLQIFDQGRIHDDRHFLEIDETEVPERYRPIVRRLQRAVAEPEVAEAM
jgi:hypothetical protein